MADSNNPPATTLDLLESLPQELYDIIKALTFIAPTNRAIQLNYQYTPPSIMKVDHATRAALAPTYYAGNRFVFKFPQLMTAFDEAFDLKHWDLFPGYTGSGDPQRRPRKRKLKRRAGVPKNWTPKGWYGGGDGRGFWVD